MIKKLRPYLIGQIINFVRFVFANRTVLKRQADTSLKFCQEPLLSWGRQFVKHHKFFRQVLSAFFPVIINKKTIHSTFHSNLLVGASVSCTKSKQAICNLKKTLNCRKYSHVANTQNVTKLFIPCQRYIHFFWVSNCTIEMAGLLQMWLISFCFTVYN